MKMRKNGGNGRNDGRRQSVTFLVSLPIALSDNLAVTKIRKGNNRKDGIQLKKETQGNLNLEKSCSCMSMSHYPFPSSS